MPPKGNAFGHGGGGGGGGKPKLVASFCRKPMMACNVCCCAPCQIGRQCSAINGVNKTLAIPYCIGSLLGPGFHICICCIRMKVSEKYGMQENCMVSMIMAFTCPFCSLLQTQQILRRAGARPGLTIKPPNIASMPDGPQKDKLKEARKGRREKRQKKNADRRSRRGKGGDSSSESDSSDSD